MLVVFFDDSFWSDARVSYQVKRRLVEAEPFCLLFLVLVCQVGPKYIEEDLAAVKVLGSDVGLALGGMGDVVVFPTCFLIHLAA